MTAPFYKSYDVGPSTVSGPYQPIPGGTATPASTGGMSGGDWASIIASIGSAALSSMGDSGKGVAGTRKEARESKRRTLANLLNQSLLREQKMRNAQSLYGSQMTDSQIQGLQNTARGFVNALSGSTR